MIFNAINTVTSAFNKIGKFVKLLEYASNFQPDGGSYSDILMYSKLQEKTSPAMDYLFLVRLPDIYEIPEEVDKIYRDDFNKNFKKRFDSQNLFHRVYSADSPSISFESEKMNVGGSHYYIAGGREYGNLTLRVDEYEDGLTQLYFSEWIRMIKNNNIQSIPAVYKKRIEIMRLSTMGGFVFLSKITLNGCFPTALTVSEFNSDGSGISQYNVTFSVDSVNYSPAKDRVDFERLADEIKTNISRQSKPLEINMDPITKILGRFL